MTDIAEIIERSLAGDPFGAVPTDPPLIAAERLARRKRLSDFNERTHGREISWGDISSAYVFRPHGQGIWADVVRTRRMGLTFDIAQSVLLSGEAYGEKSPNEDRFEYAYPRPSNRSAAEIESMKAAQEYCMPIFFVESAKRSGSYAVRVAWVIDADDDARTFLLGFAPPTASEIRDDSIDNEPFPMGRGELAKRVASRILRPGQRNFNFDVFKRYGSRCAMCRVSVRVVLTAAHIIPVAESGPDDARNGLVLCPLHHVAFDAGLVRINPESLTLEVASEVNTVDLAITVSTLKSLPSEPAQAALKWRYERYRSHKRKNFSSLTDETESC